MDLPSMIASACYTNKTCQPDVMIIPSWMPGSTQSNVRASWSTCLGEPASVRHVLQLALTLLDRKSTRLNSSHTVISYAVFCLKKKKQKAATTASLGGARADRNDP